MSSTKSPGHDQTEDRQAKRVQKYFWWIAAGIAILLLVAAAVLINSAAEITGSDKISSTISADNGDLKINWSRYPEIDVALSGALEITDSGTYHLTGTITDGLVAVNAPDGAVRLILDNVTIINNSGPAIACYDADDLVIELVGENTLMDGGVYSAAYDEDVKSAIYSKADLTFQGEGSLYLTASYQDGIVSKDDLKFNGGEYHIVSADDGIRGKDSVYIVAGVLTINSGADAIKSTNETDAGKGFVMVEAGTFDIVSGSKGIKAINSILINGGDFAITSVDDAIHSNNYIGISSGDFQISSKDDGIHADREIIVDGGSIAIEKSYEGLEAQAITINGGDINIAASDDGINAGGGADSSASNRTGAGAFDADMSCIIAINGGQIHVNSSGDGVDSNGYLYFNGGSTIIDGPTNSGNGALDAGAGIIMNGGEVIAVGASGMAESLGQSSSIYSLSIYFPSTNPAGTLISVMDSTGTEIVSHVSAKSFDHAAIGLTALKKDETYSIYIDGELYQTATISSIVTTIGQSQMQSGVNGSPTRRVR